MITVPWFVAEQTAAPPAPLPDARPRLFAETEDAIVEGWIQSPGDETLAEYVAAINAEVKKMQARWDERAAQVAAARADAIARDERRDPQCRAEHTVERGWDLMKGRCMLPNHHEGMHEVQIGSDTFHWGKG